MTLFKYSMKQALKTIIFLLSLISIILAGSNGLVVKAEQFKPNDTSDVLEDLNYYGIDYTLFSSDIENKFITLKQFRNEDNELETYLYMNYIESLGYNLNLRYGNGTYYEEWDNYFVEDIFVANLDYVNHYNYIVKFEVNSISLSLDPNYLSSQRVYNDITIIRVNYDTSNPEEKHFVFKTDKDFIFNDDVTDNPGTDNPGTDNPGTNNPSGGVTGGEVIEENLNINQSVDEDLKAMNLDYTRYKVNPSLVYRPIVINYNESTSKDYYDLFYVYDPNNEFDLKTITLDIKVGEDTEKLSLYKEFDTYTVYNAGVSEDGTIKRYALNGYGDYRNEYSYRQYEIRFLDRYEINNIYLFDEFNGMAYSNCMNIALENAHNWSWHFDEDTSDWENIKDWFKRSDILKDQLFYSFYIPDKWDVVEIKEIDIQYKKVLLDAYRHNVADTGNVHEYYSNVDDEKFKPMFYKWNDSNTDSTIDRSNFLGNKLSDFSNNIKFTDLTIKSKDKTSVGVGHSYEWDTILSLKEFGDSFGTDSEIYKFAKSNYLDSVSNNYWIINYDEFYYFYEQSSISPAIDANLVFCDYLNNKGAEFINSIAAPYYKAYKFTEEYTFDISAKSITFEDSNNVTRKLPVSVAPVMDKEGSGGESEFPEVEEMFEKILMLVAILIVVIILGYFSPVFKFVFNVIIKAIVFVISAPFKLLSLLIGKRKE